MNEAPPDLGLKTDEDSALFRPQQILADLHHPTLASFIDMARWMAAAMVMVAHLRNPLFLGYGSLSAQDKPLWVRCWYFLTGYHAEAVLIFFVLSGFLVGGLSMARARQGTFSSPNYAIDRISRLFIAFAPAVLVTFLLDWIGSNWLVGSGLYNGMHPMIVEKIHGVHFEDHLTLPIVLGNLAMLQNYYVPTLGSNDPLWTLSTEFWFYFVFGCMLTAWGALGTARGFLLFAALIACMALGGEFVLLFGLWLIGFLAACIRPAKPGPVWLPLSLLVSWLVFMRIEDGLFDANLSLKDAAHYVMAIFFGWTILSMRGRTSALMERIAGFNRFMADFSYSLYLIHFPLLIFMVALLGMLTGKTGFMHGFRPTDPVGLASYAGLILFIFSVSWGFAQLTEQKTGKLRRWLKSRLGVA